MNRVGGKMLPENFRVNLLLVIAALLFFIFSTGRAAPSQIAPQLIIAPA